MKKIFTFFLGLSLLFAFTSCDDDDPEVPQFTIEGRWQPIQVVENIVENDVITDSNVYVYTDCQQQSRFIFNADLSGRKTQYGMLSGSCIKTFDYGMNYTFDYDSGEIFVQYISTQEEGFVKDLTATSMNLTLHEIDTTTNTYTSYTYTLVRVDL